jgi:hypothetical protein
MIFKQNFLVLNNIFLVKLCLELFRCSNLAHFHLECRKSNQNGTATRKKSPLCETVQSRDGQNFNLAHDWTDLI